MNQQQDDELRRLWQSNEPERKMNSVISISEIRAASDAFERKLRFRDWREHVAASIVVASFGWRAFHAHSWLEAASCVELIGAAIWTTWLLVRKGASDPGANATVKELLQFHRARLDRQIQLLSSVIAWCLVPIGVGILGILTADTMRLGFTPAIAMTMILCALVFVAVAILNKRAAAKLAKQRALLPNSDE